MKIEYLANHTELIPTIAELFYREWGYLYPNQTLDDVIIRIQERTNTDKIPLALVAFQDEEFVGTVCLKEHDMDTRPDLTPWFAGLYVVKSKRGQGIGSKLVCAIEKRAGELGIDTLYLYTPESETFYHKLGWKVLERPLYHSCRVSVMRKEEIVKRLSDCEKGKNSC